MKVSIPIYLNTGYYQVTLITIHKFNAQEINAVRSKIAFWMNVINEKRPPIFSRHKITLGVETFASFCISRNKHSRIDNFKNLGKNILSIIMKKRNIINDECKKDCFNYNV